MGNDIPLLVFAIFCLVSIVFKVVLVSVSLSDFYNILGCWQMEGD